MNTEATIAPDLAEFDRANQIFTTPNLVGNYAFLLTGNLFLPAPYDAFNGPFFRVARFTSDGNGNLELSTVIANYGGKVLRENYKVTYTINPDGSFRMFASEVPMPGVPDNVSHAVILEGVLAEGGEKAVLGVTGFMLDGEMMPNVGSVISGQIIRQ